MDTSASMHTCSSACTHRFRFSAQVSLYLAKWIWPVHPCTPEDVHSAMWLKYYRSACSFLIGPGKCIYAHLQVYTFMCDSLHVFLAQCIRWVHPCITVDVHAADVTSVQSACVSCVVFWGYVRDTERIMDMYQLFMVFVCSEVTLCGWQLLNLLIILGKMFLLHMSIHTCWCIHTHTHTDTHARTHSHTGTV